MKGEILSAISFGETMIRLSTKNFERIEQAKELAISIGGAESNFAIAFARLGGKAAWISKLTRNPLGRFIVNKIREHGVDVSPVIWTDKYRVGVYYIEFGRAPRSTMVIYDRKNSAISNIRPDEIDWSILRDYDVFHTTGITVALSENCKRAVEDGIESAHKYGTLVSFDVNYRSKLWSPKEAKEKLEPILRKVDILFITKNDARLVLGFDGENKTIIEAIYEKYEPRIAVLTLGSEGAMAISDGQIFYAEPYNIEIVDRIGAGDAFDAGFVFRLLESNDIESALNWGVAMAAFAHTIPGDLMFVERYEIEEIIRRKTKTDIIR